MCILLGWFQLKLFIQVNISATSKDTVNTIKVMSYNVNLFDLYRLPKSTNTRDKIFDVINDETPDIICLQEFYKQDIPGFNTLDTLIQFINATNVHVEYDVTVLEKFHLGIATFSKYPILNKGVISFNGEENNGCIYTDVLIGTDTVRIYNMHLQSIHLSTTVYTDSTKTMNKEIHSKFADILPMLYSAFKERATQVEKVSENIQSCHYQKIICADLNDTPSSYAYHAIKGSLNDVFTESGNGFGQTYIGTFPSFRIDCIFHSNDFNCIEFYMPAVKLSDHYPLVCRLKHN